MLIYYTKIALQFGLFGIFDGHGGDGAARAASKLVFMLICSISVMYFILT